MSQLASATQSAVYSAIHCVNPDCAAPYPQAWGNKFCQSCGSPILLHNRYLPLQRLGVGGFAVTYSVYDIRGQQERVLKVLTDTLPKAVALFEQEARVLSRLRHPGIPRVDSDSYFEILVGNPVPRSLPCLVMEKINGQTLEEVLKQYAQGCPEAMVIGWFHQAIDILRLLHQQQIIHRDLKPANFMLRHDTRQLVVIDFGGAKQMQQLHHHAQLSSTRLVSPGYSPPEQIAGGTVQPASDFYALGRTLIHLLTGRYPLELEDPMSGELQWRSHAQVTTALADLIDDMVRLDVRQRPANANLILARLHQIAPAPTQLQLASVPAPTQPLPQVQNGHFHQGNANLKGAGRRGGSWIAKALFDTGWSMTLAGLGGGLGTMLGFELGYRSPLGVYLSLWLWERSQPIGSFLPLQFGSELLVFGAAGLGTALGLTLAGGFGQRRRPLQASCMGMLGYLSGIVGLRLAALDGVFAGLVVFGELAPVFLIFGLGLPSPRWLYAGVAALGATSLLIYLANADIWFMSDFWQFLYPEDPTIGTNPVSWWACLVLFSLLGAVLGGCLGFSRYLLHPIVRWLR